jgi:hypothetical protein
LFVALFCGHRLAPSFVRVAQRFSFNHAQYAPI